jgi:hypothetical protein
MKCCALFLLLYVPFLLGGKTYRHGQLHEREKAERFMLRRALRVLKRSENFVLRCRAASRAHKLSPVDERRASTTYEELEALEAECEKD